MSLTAYRGLGQEPEIDWQSFLEDRYLPANGGGAPSGGGSFSGSGDVGGGDFSESSGSGSLTGNIVDQIFSQAGNVLGGLITSGELPYRPGHLASYGITVAAPHYTTGPDGRLLFNGAPLSGASFGSGAAISSNQWLLIGALGLGALLLLMPKR